MLEVAVFNGPQPELKREALMSDTPSTVCPKCGRVCLPHALACECGHTLPNANVGPPNVLARLVTLLGRVIDLLLIFFGAVTAITGLLLIGSGLMFYAGTTAGFIGLILNHKKHKRASSR